jgi:hypothetical protein
MKLRAVEKLTWTIIVIMSVILSGCAKISAPKVRNINAVLTKAKWSLDSSGDQVNIYFTGKIINNTLDTLYINYRDPDTIRINFFPVNSLFFILIQGDSLFLEQFRLKQKIMPNDSIEVYFMKSLMFDEYIHKKDIKLILDTVKLYYYYPNMEKNNKMINSLIFNKSNKYTIDSLPVNAFMEGVFKLGEGMENDNYPVRIIVY